MIAPRDSMRQAARLFNRPLRVIRRKPLQPFQRQAYSSGGAHGTTEASSDLPWAIGAVVVTVPALSYILWPKPKKDHGHDHGGSEGHGDGEAHDEHNDESKNEDGDSEDGDASNQQSEGDGAEDDGKNAEEGGADEASGTAEDNESDDQTSSDEERGQDTPDSSDDERPATAEEVKKVTEDQKDAQFKGPTKDGPAGDHRTSYPDSKGGQKRRIESDYGKTLQPAQGEKDAVDSDSDDETDKAAAAKPPGSRNTMSGKQEGISNTDTKHSTDITNDPTKSKKPGGQPETAKLKGTVNPKPSEG